MTVFGDINGISVGTSHGFDALIVETPSATATVSLFGGQVLSLVPAGGDEVLWVSPLVLEPPTPIRGGTPVCWPYFSREGQTGEVPSHGYARTARWTVTGARTFDDGDIEVELTPERLDHLPMRLRMTVRVGAALEQGLHTTNPGTESLTLTEALHNYFRVSDATSVRVEGLTGLTYLDEFDDGNAHEQTGDWRLPVDLPRSDRLYPGAGGHYRLLDPGLSRAIEIVTRDARTAVVWNPGEAVAADMADVGPHWREFVCVETANAGPDVVEVAGGTTHSMWQSISVTALS
ncbi:D-hexose-6-phosphate mutarotase [Gordonia jinghuaiqii]|uniref:D-hexose-6-phosphate mutarotase n=1 Tax=Gordonia jinghuaiqii TaxID=2758710 RepID=UPI001C612016|nr:D-hexose-6-phosphate mutarotase [Gordonia jinghuaiqii]MCR5978019.1 D-hexose-6-phosphate mutarotase [Gordonia jinghuaiqii]